MKYADVFFSPVSNVPTPWAIRCARHGQVFFTEQEYDRQMNKANAVWECPMCVPWDNTDCYWDDDNYESYYYPDGD